MGRQRKEVEKQKEQLATRVVTVCTLLCQSCGQTYQGPDAEALVKYCYLQGWRITRAGNVYCRHCMEKFSPPLLHENPLGEPLPIQLLEYPARKGDKALPRYKE